MPATPSDIARFTTDGVLLTAEDPAIKANHLDAEDGAASGRELEMFYDDPADAQDMLDERFAILSQISAVHEGIEVEETLGIGTVIPLTPTVPCSRSLMRSAASTLSRAPAPSPMTSTPTATASRFWSKPAWTSQFLGLPRPRQR